MFPKITINLIFQKFSKICHIYRIYCETVSKEVLKLFWNLTIDSFAFLGILMLTPFFGLLYLVLQDKKWLNLILRMPGLIIEINQNISSISDELYDLFIVFLENYVVFCKNLVRPVTLFFEFIITSLNKSLDQNTNPEVDLYNLIVMIRVILIISLIFVLIVFAYNFPNVIEFIKYFEMSQDIVNHVNTLFFNYTCIDSESIKTNYYRIDELFKLFIGIFAYLSIFGYFSSKKIYIGYDLENSGGSRYYKIIEIIYVVLTFTILYPLVTYNLAYGRQLEFFILVGAFLTNAFFIRSSYQFKNCFLSYDSIKNFKKLEMGKLDHKITVNQEFKVEDNVDKLDSLIDELNHETVIFNKMWLSYIEHIIVGSFLNTIALYQYITIICSFFILIFGLFSGFNLLSIVIITLNLVYWHYSLSILSNGFPESAVQIILKTSYADPIGPVYIIYDDPKGDYIKTINHKNEISKIFKNSILKINYLK